LYFKSTVLETTPLHIFLTVSKLLSSQMLSRLRMSLNDSDLQYQTANHAAM